MEELRSSSLTVQKSRFYAHLYLMEREEDIAEILKEHRRMYRKAVHHCYACRLMVEGSLLEKSKDDGEVGHPGKAILETMRKKDVHGLIVVSRIFGGIKLGTGGVGRAFRDAAGLLLEEQAQV